MTRAVRSLRACAAAFLVVGAAGCPWRGTPSEAVQSGAVPVPPDAWAVMDAAQGAAVRAVRAAVLRDGAGRGLPLVAVIDALTPDAAVTLAPRIDGSVFVAVRGIVDGRLSGVARQLEDAAVDAVWLATPERKLLLGLVAPRDRAAARAFLAALLSAPPRPALAVGSAAEVIVTLTATGLDALAELLEQNIVTAAQARLVPTPGGLEARAQLALAGAASLALRAALEGPVPRWTCQFDADAAIAVRVPEIFGVDGALAALSALLPRPSPGGGSLVALFAKPPVSGAAPQQTPLDAADLVVAVPRGPDDDFDALLRAAAPGADAAARARPKRSEQRVGEVRLVRIDAANGRHVEVLETPEVLSVGIGAPGRLDGLLGQTPCPPRPAGVLARGDGQRLATLASALLGMPQSDAVAFGAFDVRGGVVPDGLELVVTLTRADASGDVVRAGQAQRGNSRDVRVGTNGGG